jgi:hypothetical protein
MSKKLCSLNMCGSIFHTFYDSTVIRKPNFLKFLSNISKVSALLLKIRMLYFEKSAHPNTLLLDRDAPLYCSLEIHMQMCYLHFWSKK